MIPDRLKQQVRNPQPDIKGFVEAIMGRKVPRKVHLVELYADVEIMRWITENVFAREWVSTPSDPTNIEQYKKSILCEIDYWYRMGYDFVKISGGIRFPVPYKRSSNP